MKILKHICCFFMWVTILSIVHCDLTEEEEDMIDSFFEEILECRRIPGAVVSLVRDGEIELTKGYGFANLETEEPFTSDHKFALGSTSKQFTATLAAKLMASEIGLTWDTIARDVLGDDFHFIDGYRSNNTMLRDLISHQTGIQAYDGVWALGSFDTREEIVMERVRYMEERYPIRSEFVYTGIMYDVLALVLEQTFGASWEDLVSRELFTPMGMNSSTFYDYAAPDYDGFTTPYTSNFSTGQPFDIMVVPYETNYPIRLIGPAGSVCSTANDMARWMQFVLSGGLSPEGERIMEQEDLERLWYPESAYTDTTGKGKPFEPVTDSLDTYGLGYFNGHYRGYRVETHGGSLAGFINDYYLIPDMNIGIFYNSNYGGLEIPYIHSFLADILLGEDPVYNATYVCEKLDLNKSSQDEENNFYTTLSKLYSQTDMEMFSSYEMIEYAYDMTMKPTEQFVKEAIHNKILFDVKNMLNFQSNSATRMVENYEGIYGNFAFGNMTITVSNACADCLFMEYGEIGLWTLEPTDIPDYFLGFNEYPIFRLLPVEFIGDNNGNIEYASISLTGVSTPKLFERDLLMSEAPLPRNDLCEPVY